jgi:hypothetical protein
MEPFLLLLFGAITAASTLPGVRFFKIHDHLRFIALLGFARRGYLHGTGRQACWAYLGYTIRVGYDPTARQAAG